MEHAKLDKLYHRAHDLVTVAKEDGQLPRDIENAWPNALGTLRRCTGSIYHRPGPNGIIDNPSAAELEALEHYFTTTIARIERKGY